MKYWCRKKPTLYKYATKLWRFFKCPFLLQRSVCIASFPIQSLTQLAMFCSQFCSQTVEGNCEQNNINWVNDFDRNETLILLVTELLVILTNCYKYAIKLAYLNFSIDSILALFCKFSKKIEIKREMQFLAQFFARRCSRLLHYRSHTEKCQ